jgi:dihydropteroate synthase
MYSESVVKRIRTTWKLRSRELVLGEHSRVMGIVNITADSFSDGGLYLNSDLAVEHALRLLDDGADLIDLGAESTRPGAQAGDPENAVVSADEEQVRLLPVLEALLKTRPETVVSVDTYKASTARAAVAASAEIVNDVSGFSWDAAMAGACAELACGVVLMHTRGKPQEWRKQSRLRPEEVLPLVRNGLSLVLQNALAAGVSAEAIVLDPGYGFGKRLDENFVLLSGQPELLALGRPLLAGLSRKSFLEGGIHPAKDGRDSTRAEPAARFSEARNIAGIAAAILQGASIVRVHDVRSAREAAAVVDTLVSIS